MLFGVTLVTGVTVRRGEALDFSGVQSRPQTGSLHPIAEAGASSFDLLKRGALS